MIRPGPDTVADDILSGAENDGTWGMDEYEAREFAFDEFEARRRARRRMTALPIPNMVYWEVRRVVHDAFVTDWIPFPEVKGPTREHLAAYLIKCYGQEATLGPTLGNNDVLDDGRYQYRRVKP